jgi:hypothetical protein
MRPAPRAGTGAPGHIPGKGRRGTSRERGAGAHPGKGLHARKACGAQKGLRGFVVPDRHSMSGRRRRESNPCTGLCRPPDVSEMLSRVIPVLAGEREDRDASEPPTQAPEGPVHPRAVRREHCVAWPVDGVDTQAMQLVVLSDHAGERLAAARERREPAVRQADDTTPGRVWPRWPPRQSWAPRRSCCKGPLG